MTADLGWLENPQVFQVNRLDAHSDHHFFETEKDYEEGRETLRQSLNGEWLFSWSPCAGERKKDFYKMDEELGNFDRIQVPGHMELQGYGQIHYTNTIYPWDGHKWLRPPQIDWENDPVGSYVKEFDVDQALLGKRICISFQGVEQAMYVWLNGNFVGYAEDSFTPSEFDLTPYIRGKGNRLCVEVYKRSSAAWIEDQDFFRFSGIFRDVYLYAKPVIHIEDLWLQSGLADDYETGTLTVKLKISGQTGEQGVSLGKESGYRVNLCIKDRDGQELYDGLLELELEKDGYLTSRQILFPKVQVWDHEHPYLYLAELTVKGEDGKTAEIVPYKIGFRRFEIKDKIMLLNGKRLIIHGVNRHEWNPERGRSITKEDMIADMEMILQNHINAVRTCHYPDQSFWYELCDEQGIYLMDEANLESHGSWQKLQKCEPSWNVPGNLPEWKDCVVDRAVSMLERDKNHVSVLFWSCGNESYAGKDILAMSDFFHKKDPSRLVHYEGVFWNREFAQISDVESRMYAKPEEVRRYLENDPQKPFILCEYMHNMGNSLGGMESYMRLFDEFPMYQGGFIWDYIDQALYLTGADGKRHLGYGGDFFDRPTDYGFSANGLLFADRKAKPAMQEVTYWYQKAEIREKEDRDKRRSIDSVKGQMEKEKRQREDEIEEMAAGLKVARGDGNLGVKGDGFEILFSYSEGGPVSIVYEGKEWLYRAPRFALWRAPTENDRGNGFAVESAMWMGADRWQKCVGYEVACEEKFVTVTYDFELPTVPVSRGKIRYRVDAKGGILVKASLQGDDRLPGLPCFGLRFVMPYEMERFRWVGLSGETYPDRKHGGKFGIHESEAAVADYLVPQENGCHMDTYQMVLEHKNAKLDFIYEKEPFGFGALPVTAQELEAVYHKEELAQGGRTIVSIYGAMRGVGGIDSWGADVEEAYQIPAGKDLEVSVFMKMGESNPVLEGLYADPELAYFDGRYYLYPTTDGFPGWSGTSFSVFSSADGQHFRNEGTILDLATEQVPWAVGSAWAPCIVRKNEKYYFYFCGKNGEGVSCIGAAVGESPTGPFFACPEPMVTMEMMKEHGIVMNQTIDPSVYVEGNDAYLLFGNGKPAIAKLKEDMLSILPETLANLEGAYEFREAVTVLKRDGMYHFTWSCDDTGSEDYHVNYGTSRNLYGPIRFERTILKKKGESLGTGHHSILQIPGEDRYKIAYHRFATPLENYPEGKGYHREVCLGNITFDESGKMKKVEL